MSPSRRRIALPKFYGFSPPQTQNSLTAHPGCAIIHAMRFLPRFGGRDGSFEGVEDAGVAHSDTIATVPAETVTVEESGLLKTIGWLSAALGAVAIGLIVGREIRQRYKFNRRTPYDLYSHSGDELPDADLSVGI